ncbi:MAG: protein kinase [Lachnospiraceae bacterium]|nr:protein kinase [Lachnospiraceae bacterium]
MRNVFDFIKKRITKSGEEWHEVCPRCQADLTMQKGFDKTLDYWVCLGCGELCINNDKNIESDVVWICDSCGDYLNLQDGFDESAGKWECAKCGYINYIDDEHIYLSEDEYISDQNNPYKGLSDSEILNLSLYRKIRRLEGREDILIVEERETKKLFVEKHLRIYDKTVYEYLKENPVSCMPKIEELFESENCLIVIEEYVEGITLDKVIETTVMPELQASVVALMVCKCVLELHSAEPTIIHRDIKPSNIIIKPDGEVWLLDVNTAKWYDSEEADDTRYLGTENYAAPEQMGYGLSASSEKTDVYAIGVLLNVMLTGHFPKEKKADGKLWDIIEKCICLDADKRISDIELTKLIAGAFNEYLQGEQHGE